MPKLSDVVGDQYQAVTACVPCDHHVMRADDGAFGFKGAADIAVMAAKKLGTFLTACYGSVSEAKSKLGSLSTVKEAFKAMQEVLYSN